jgi:predicted Kef-type K+ transport protein
VIGVAVGPHALGLVSDLGLVEAVATIGVVLLGSIVELTVAMAKKEATQEELLRWLRRHQNS